MQQFSCGSIGFDFTLLIAGEGIDSAAENYGRFFLSQPQFLAYAAEFLTLPLTGALDKFIARLAVPDLVGVVEPAVLTRRAKSAGKAGEGDGLPGMTDGFGAIFFAYHTLVSATHALNDFAHGNLHLLFFKLDHGQTTFAISGMLSPMVRPLSNAERVNANASRSATMTWILVRL